MTGSRSFLIFLCILMEIVLYGAETSDVLPGVGNIYVSDGKVERPYFEVAGPRNVTYIVGHHAQLHCRVRHAGDRMVSWIRKRDLHVLSSNQISFTSDARFSVIHPQDSDDFNLQIKFVQKRDAGIYECQIPNLGETIKYQVLLNVEEAQAMISGPEFVRTSSTISLTCSVNIHSQPAGSVTWYHGQNVVDFNSPRGGISMETTKSESGIVSKLVITKATSSDGGNYTCIPVPSHAGPASVMVHVVNGEHSEPIHHVEHNSTGGSQSTCSLRLNFLFVILAINYHQLHREFH
ncbi:lachesin isoform X2 [Folsomia candida]|uniref:lachesin isoform X2 n=1 Tax=Folsomia candida TaxID=158441 RepID=UPI001604FF41|nr:lachesin isoform X2 [Folsomia candida]